MRFPRVGGLDSGPDGRCKKARSTGVFRPFYWCTKARLPGVRTRFTGVSHPSCWCTEPVLPVYDSPLCWRNDPFCWCMSPVLLVYRVRSAGVRKCLQHLSNHLLADSPFCFLLCSSFVLHPPVLRHSSTTNTTHYQSRFSSHMVLLLGLPFYWCTKFPLTHLRISELHKPHVHPPAN